MKTSIDGLAMHRIGMRTVLACAALASMTSLAGAQPSPSAITAITLERNGFGAPSGTVLVLRRDGSASLTETGSARLGTGDAVASGAMHRKDFDALAHLVVARGFFALDDSYEDPQLRDGSWTTVGVSTGRKQKQVFVREDAGPESLKAIETAIESARSRIVFTPANR